jgi:hypothetical protein
MDTELPSQEPERQKIAGKPDEQGGKPGNETPQTKISVTRPVSDIPPSPPNPQKPHCDGKHTHKSKPNWVEVCTFILEIFGIIGLFYYCLINKRELNVFDSERVTMEHDFQANQKFAQRQLDEINHTRSLDERAWITIDDFIIQSNMAEHPNMIYVTPVAKNIGRTPAINCAVLVSSTFDTNAIKRITTIQNPAAYHDRATIVEPGKTVGFDPEPNDFTFYPTDFKIRKESPLYIYGTVFYDDIFGQHHWVQFGCGIVQFSPSLKLYFLPNNSCDDVQTNQNN